MSINEGIPAPSVEAPGRKVEQYFGLSQLHDGRRLVGLWLGERLQSQVYYNCQKHMGYNVQADLPRAMGSLFHWGGVQYK